MRSFIARSTGSVISQFVGAARELIEARALYPSKKGSCSDGDERQEIFAQLFKTLKEKGSHGGTTMTACLFARDQRRICPGVLVLHCSIQAGDVPTNKIDNTFSILGLPEFHSGFICREDADKRR
jgi:hypothetical protein